MVSICRKCWYPGHRAKNSIKARRKADLQRLLRSVKVKVRNNYALYFREEVGGYYCDVWRVSHAFEDQTKNLSNHSTRWELKYRMARQESPKNKI